MGSGVEYEAPRNQTEEKLAAIWADILGKEKISIRDNFFELGGNSLKAIRLTAQFKGLLIVDFYKYPTIGELAKILDSREGKTYLQRINSPSSTGEVSVIIVPYAGGDPVVYQRMALQLNQLSSQFDVYSVALHHGSNINEVSVTEEQIILQIINEIETEIEKPILLYGECVGAGLTMLLAELLIQAGKQLIGIAVGAAMPITKYNGLYADRDKSEMLLTNFKRIGADIPSEPEGRRILAENISQDILMGRASYNYLITKIQNKTFKKIEVPFFCIVGENDPITRFYKYRYSRWKHYVSSVQLKVVRQVGHYLSRDRPVEVAEIINEIVYSNYKNSNKILP